MYTTYGAVARPRIGMRGEEVMEWDRGGARRVCLTGLRNEFSGTLNIGRTDRPACSIYSEGRTPYTGGINRKLLVGGGDSSMRKGYGHFYQS